jgi:hypothetical protein
MFVANFIVVAPRCGKRLGDHALLHDARAALAPRLMGFISPLSNLREAVENPSDARARYRYRFVSKRVVADALRRLVSKCETTKYRNASGATVLANLQGYPHVECHR